MNSEWLAKYDISERNGYENPAFNEIQSPTKSNTDIKFDDFNNNIYRYGWKCFPNKAIQRFNKPIYFLVVMTFCVIFQGLVVSGVSLTIITSIERHFGFTSTEVGLFITGYDIGYGIFCICVGYCGHKHKPRWIAIGVFVLAIGTFINSIPQYISDSYDPGIFKPSYCNINSTNVCIPDNKGKWYYKFLFHIGQLIMGIGATPLYTLGPAHLDEITDRGQNGLYLGIFYGGSAVGPALGYIIGSQMLNYWVDIKKPEGSTNLKPEDSNWVGAWWLGYVIAAILLLLPVVPMLGFPRLFPNTEALEKKKKTLEDTLKKDERLNYDLKSIWPATKGLLKNPPFMLICLASGAEALAVGGFSTFFAKFVETQFYYTAARAGLLTGVVVVIGATSGIFIGGFLIYRYKWTCHTTLKASAVFAFIATLLTSAVFAGCDSRDIVGATVPYVGSQPSNITLDSACNSDCKCSIKYYQPLCTEEDQKTFFSACHAGCAENQKDGEFFQNCTCFPPNIQKAKDGRCTPSCNLFPLFAVLSFFLMMFTFMNNVPMLNATLRVVPEGQGSFALGFQQIFVRFLGFIPAPSLFGVFIDKSCSLWHRDECTFKRTSCLEYDNQEFRNYFFGLGAITKFLSFVFVLLAWKFYRLPNPKTITREENHSGYAMTGFAES